jgi:hypothetical protein
MVRIGSGPRPVAPAAGWLYALICLFWVGAFGLVAYFALVIPALTLTWHLAGFAAAVGGSVLFGVRGWILFRDWFTRKLESAFDGQVVARWEVTVTDGETAFQERHVAVDDGRRGWNFVVLASDFACLSIGELVHVRVLIQSGRLLSMVRTVSDAIQPAP